MPEFSPESIVAHYRIIRRLGQGGMGIVYEAEDTKLGRRVALKFLPEQTQKDPAALERFWREARAVSALNHPGICTVYELNDENNPPFISMELLEGQSLEKVAAGPPSPLPKLLDMGAQMADAIEAAHRKGIIHRDIKPANIFLSPSGQTKLLDFGLAKLEEAVSDETVAATQAAAMLTSAGSAIGTVAYMSPEQARGEVLDGRTDIFSLGVVLYELSTGEKAFPGSTTAVVFDRILNHSPVEAITLNPELPPEFERILSKALEKDRDLRYQSATELRADLRRLLRGGSSGSGSVAAVSSSQAGFHPSRTGAVARAAGPVKKSKAWLWVSLGVLVLAAAGLAASKFWPRTLPFTNFTVEQVTNSGDIAFTAISPDGRTIAEVRRKLGQDSLFIRNLPTHSETQILPAFAGKYKYPVFSPDGNSLFFSRSTPESPSLYNLYSVPVFGGTPQLVIKNNYSSISFSPDGQRLVAIVPADLQKNDDNSLVTLQQDGSDVQVLANSDHDLLYPSWSPDGKSIALILQHATGEHQLVMHAVDPNKKGEPSDAEKETVPTPTDLQFFGLSWMPDGRDLLVAWNGRDIGDARMQIGVYSLDSRRFRTITSDTSSYGKFNTSADAKVLAATQNQFQTILSTYSKAGGSGAGGSRAGGSGGPHATSTPQPITRNQMGGQILDLVWMTDGKIAFAQEGRFLEANADGSEAHSIFSDPKTYVSSVIDRCSDGRFLLLAHSKADGFQSHIYSVNADGGGVRQLTKGEGEVYGQCSPDSKTLYYSSHNEEHPSILSMPMGGGPAKELTSTPFPQIFRISPDGKQLFSPTVAHDASHRFAAARFDLEHNMALSDQALDPRVLPGNFTLKADSNAYVVSEKGQNALWGQSYDGSGGHALTEFSPDLIEGWDWSPDGTLVVSRVHIDSNAVVIRDTTGAAK